jgi:hypothetical protein
MKNRSKKNNILIIAIAAGVFALGFGNSAYAEDRTSEFRDEGEKNIKEYVLPVANPIERTKNFFRSLRVAKSDGVSNEKGNSASSESKKEAYENNLASAIEEFRALQKEKNASTVSDIEKKKHQLIKAIDVIKERNNNVSGTFSGLEAVVGKNNKAVETLKVRVASAQSETELQANVEKLRELRDSDEVKKEALQRAVDGARGAVEKAESRIDSIDSISASLPPHHAFFSLKKETETARSDVASARVNADKALTLLSAQPLKSAEIISRLSNAQGSLRNAYTVFQKIAAVLIGTQR